MDSKDMTDQSGSSSEIFKNSQDEFALNASAQIKSYYSLMNDEGPDDVFIQPSLPPSCKALLSPTEGNICATTSDSGMTLPSEAADATKANTNPWSLNRHHGETCLMETRNKLEEEISTTQSSMEFTDNTLLSNDMICSPTDCQDQTPLDGSAFLMERCYDKTGKAEQNSTSGDEDSEKELNGPKQCKEEENYEFERGKFLQQIYLNQDEIAADKINLETEFDKTYKDISSLEERDFKLSSTMPDSDRSDDFPSLEPSESCGFPKSRMEERTSNFPTEMGGENVEHFGIQYLDSNHTSSELSFRKDSGETVEQVDGTRRIATDIQHGEQLLQRLQMVQLRHDDIPNTRQEIIKVVKAEEEGSYRSEVEEKGIGRMSETSEEEEEEGESKGEEGETNPPENENSGREHIQTEVRKSLSTQPGMPEYNQINKKDAEECLDHYSEVLIPSALPLHSLQEMPCEIPLISAGHRFSAAETSMEKQIQEAARAKQNLQRAGGVFNLADNPDVLEIPFKTDVSLDSLLTKACTMQQNQWQFSEKKMQKEISQDIQRELVLVNQGKIPGEYCKGEVRQLKETKLLFEAFQQVKTEGPTRNRKLPTSEIKGHVYPSVLERTRSLETFSLKTSTVSRAHSLRLFNSATLEREKSPETLRSKSPTGGSRDKTRLSPYSKQDKHLRLHRSMDSINSESSTSSAQTRAKTKERQGSPILRQNPFFKLRPAMALQPEVEKDIREAKEREEELRRQRCTLYGEDRQKSEEEEKHRYTKTLKSDVKLQSRGKLERLWPPPSKKDQKKSEEGQQELKVHRAGGQKAPLWQLWESGLINGQASDEKK